MAYDRHDYMILINNKHHASFGMRGSHVVWAHPIVSFLCDKSWNEVMVEARRRGWAIVEGKVRP
jgi:hypothetical protein